MRIGIFSDTYLPEINGVASSSATLAKELAKHGHDVYVVTTKIGHGKCEWEGNILRLGGIELKFLYGYSMTSFFHLDAYEEIKKLHLDLIHVQTEFGVGIFARICARQLNIPLVSTYHTTYEDYTHYVNLINSKTVDKAAKNIVGKLSRLYGDSSTEVIAPSEKTRQMLLRYKIKRNIYVVPTGLDIKRFNPKNTTAQTINAIREQFDIASDDKLIIFVGRIAKEKSIDIVIEAFNQLHDKTKKVKLLIVGGGPDLEGLQEMVKRYGIEDTVKFAGKVENNIIEHYYHSAQAFVSASLTETQGMTYVEALASGLMVFARYDNVLDDLVVKGQTGYFFKDANDLANQLLAFDKMSKEELKHHEDACIKQTYHYDEDIFYENIIHVYEQAILSYRNLFEIERIKTRDEYVELILRNPSDEKVDLLISYDTYFNFGLRKNEKLTSEMVEKLEKETIQMKAYVACVKMIARKDRTTKEIYDYLTNETACDIEMINDIVDQLEERNYINDHVYTQNMVHNMKMTLQGEKKIIHNLKKKGIPYDMIVDIIDSSDPDEEYENALKWAQKLQKTINGKSVKMKQKAMYQKLLARGFDVEIINRIMDDLSFNQETKDEIDNLKNCATKARRRYEKKAKDESSLRNSIFKYCIAQGYQTEDVYTVLDEMEWDDEND
ncbi:MAG: RecX family transcriptional regulator [Erysipelotrichaceae bacterium]|nr:RecX family transcriptional regulator [Erysipelotrichaceae bacterium]MDY5252229.1 RecX family transcriptional regulator [Erysipelotrichaceae bacterium]